MKLYFHPGSSNARKARLAAALSNIELELVLVDVFSGAHKKPEYLAVNPNGMIPALDDDGYVLWEANAIAQYIASKKPSTDVFPTELRARADVVRWHCWDLAHFTPAVQSIVFERVFKKVARMGAPDQAAVDKGLASFHRFAKVLDAHLEGREHLVGKSVTIADTSVAASLTHATPAEIPLGDYKNVQRWFSSVEKLDAWRKTAPPPLG